MDWPDKHGILYWALCFMRHKTHFGANLYVEDSEQHINEFKAANSDVIIFTNSTNRGLSGLRSNNWREVKNIVLKRYLLWQTSHPWEDQKLELHAESEGIKKGYRCVACGTIMNQMRKRI